MLANNLYSILINEEIHGFFHSSRGLKQGDPSLPSLFILAAEVLSKNINELFNNEEFKSFGKPKRTEQINLLSYTDDTIIFTTVNKKNM